MLLEIMKHKKKRIKGHIEMIIPVCRMMKEMGKSDCDEFKYLSKFCKSGMGLLKETDPTRFFPKFIDLMELMGECNKFMD